MRGCIHQIWKLLNIKFISWALIFLFFGQSSFFVNDWHGIVYAQERPETPSNFQLTQQGDSIILTWSMQKSTYTKIPVSAGAETRRTNYNGFDISIAVSPRIQKTYWLLPGRPNTGDDYAPTSESNLSYRDDSKISKNGSGPVTFQLVYTTNGAKGGKTYDSIPNGTHINIVARKDQNLSQVATVAKGEIQRSWLSDENISAYITDKVNGDPRSGGVEEFKSFMNDLKTNGSRRSVITILENSNTINPSPQFKFVDQSALQSMWREYYFNHDGSQESFNRKYTSIRDQYLAGENSMIARCEQLSNKLKGSIEGIKASNQANDLIASWGGMIGTFLPVLGAPIVIGTNSGKDAAKWLIDNQINDDKGEFKQLLIDSSTLQYRVIYLYYGEAKAGLSKFPNGGLPQSTGLNPDKVAKLRTLTNILDKALKGCRDKLPELFKQIESELGGDKCTDAFKKSKAPASYLIGDAICGTMEFLATIAISFANFALNILIYASGLQ